MDSALIGVTKMALVRGFGVGFVAAFCGFICPVTACDVHSANEAIDAILHEIRDGTVNRIDVLSIPEDMITFRSISPQMMEELTAERYSIRIAKEDMPQLLVSVTALRPKRENDSGDLRWGFWFLDGSGRRVHSILLDGERWYAKGRRGYIDGNRCNFSSSLIHWVRNLRSCSDRRNCFERIAGGDAGVSSPF
ncbi:hypothetical protein [Bradyrhizobium sp. USDA 4454]